MPRFRWLSCLVVAILVGFVPSAANARPIFNYNGASNDGGIVWDGDGDAGTANSICTDSNPCITDQLGATNPDDIRAVVTISDPFDPLNNKAQFTSFTAALLLSVPTVPTCSAPLTCESIADYLAANGTGTFHFKPAVEFIDRNQAPDNNYLGLVILPLIAPTIFDSVTSEFILFTGSMPDLLLTPESKAFLTANPSFMANGFFGLSLEFAEILQPGQDPNDPPKFVPFSVALEPALTSPTPVPEPASMLLLGSGLAGMVARRYRRRNSASQS